MVSARHLAVGAETKHPDWRLDRLIGRLPRRGRAAVHRLRQPSSFWIRTPAGVLLVCGGVLGFLPILGFWMLPLGLALLADDVPPLRVLRNRILDWIERRHPGWLAAPVSTGGQATAEDTKEAG
jgi:hypothetical protein